MSLFTSCIYNEAFVLFIESNIGKWRKTHIATSAELRILYMNRKNVCYLRSENERVIPGDIAFSFMMIFL